MRRAQADLVASRLNLMHSGKSISAPEQQPDLVVTELLGSADEARFAEREVDRLFVAWNDASKRRLRGKTERGCDIAIDLPRGSFLHSGAVLNDDGRTIAVVARSPERALVLRPESPAQGALIGHVFGNQHVPIQIVGDEIRVPITTSEALAAETARGLGAVPEIRSVELWPDSPPTTHAHR
jgi:urease accessory protein